jgi:hypothetical protein
MSTLTPQLSTGAINPCIVSAWSPCGFVKDSGIKAVTVLPEVAPNTTEEELSLDWDAIMISK